MDPRFPIGQFSCPTEVKREDVEQWIKEISLLPHRLRELLDGQDEVSLKKTYRENSWTVRQLVHHIADSHLNGYVRMKLALTEESPVVKTYEEKEWAKLADYELPVGISIQQIDLLHERWTFLLNRLSEKERHRVYMLPDGSEMRIEQSIALYAWHGKHHLAHIQLALK
ncbi:YfiT family bacillithiol transferase [Marinicrinis lubricantis]|uniref:YfiT family bacillithiol transferase n=1 Tax=Marinicrinis lubricantis TaxID=2086470 RepID=A0ABW1IK95_9BACL